MPREVKLTLPTLLRLAWSPASGEPTILRGLRPRISGSVCFSCFRKLSKETQSREHVFPRWLQSRFYLRERTLILPNRSPIRYEKILVPACKDCNTGYLSNMESMVAAATERYDSATSLPTNLFASWCAKVFYALYLKGAFLKSDRSHPKSKRLIPRGWVRQINNVRTLILTAAPGFQVIGEHSSVVVLPCSTDLPQGLFDYIDMPDLLSLSIRLGPIGVIVCLGDGALVRNHLSPGFYQDYANAPLNALRFREATASVFARRAHLEWTPEPLFLESKGVIDCVINTAQLSTSPIFAQMDLEVARHIYAKVLDISPEQIVTDNDGRFIFRFPSNHHLAKGLLS